MISKLDGEIATFKDIPCYAIHGRLETEGLFLTNKCFAANGYLYIVQLISAELPAPGENNLEAVFSAFEFVGTPHVPKPRSPGEQRAYEAGRLMGQIIGYCIIGAVLFTIVKRLTCRKKTAAVESASELSAPPERQETQ